MNEIPAEGGIRDAAEGGIDSRIDSPAEGGMRDAAEGGMRDAAEGGMRDAAEGGMRDAAEGGIDSRIDSPAEGGMRDAAEGGMRDAAEGGMRDAAEGVSDDAARQILVARLAEQPRSRHELARWLARKNVPDPVAERLLNRFEDIGLIDDVAFARMWIDSRQRSKGLARRALSFELQRKGIDDDIAREALDEIDSEAERQSAHRLVAKKLRSMQSVSTDAQKRRLLGMLARKGYPSQMAYDVVHSELSSSDG